MVGRSLGDLPSPAELVGARMPVGPALRSADQQSGSAAGKPLMRGLTGDDAAADTLGDVQVTALVDILTSSTTAEIFASSTLPWPLEELSRRFPEDFQDDSWRFIVRCFLVQAGATAILVDAGAGPATTGMCQAMGIEGELLDRLGDLGVAEDDIDHVVITHLHEDHVGWLTVPAQGGPRATFPRASYHLHPADFKLAHDLRDSSRGRYWDDTFTPLALSGQLDLHPGAQVLAPGVAIRNAPGHDECPYPTMPIRPHPDPTPRCRAPR